MNTSRISAVERVKAAHHLCKCNFCGNETTLTNLPNSLLAHKCNRCGAIGMLKRGNTGKLFISWIIPDVPSDVKSISFIDLLTTATPEELRQYVKRCGYDRIVCNQCNEALKKKGLKPEF